MEEETGPEERTEGPNEVMGVRVDAVGLRAGSACSIGCVEMEEVEGAMGVNEGPKFAEGMDSEAVGVVLWDGACVGTAFAAVSLLHEVLGIDEELFGPRTAFGIDNESVGVMVWDCAFAGTTFVGVRAECDGELKEAETVEI